MHSPLLAGMSYMTGSLSLHTLYQRRLGSDNPGAVAWPAGPVQVAALLRTQASRMASDLNTVLRAYIDALGPAWKSQGIPEGALHQAQDLQHELSAAHARALSVIESAFRSLLYPVLARELVTRVAAVSP